MAMSLEETRQKNAVAFVDTRYCINCGKCRRICPEEASIEYQRPICRLCPDCGEGRKMFPSEIRSFAPLHSCSLGCPLGTVPEGYINLIREGRIQDAYDLIAELNPLPVTCASICTHPCMDDCKRGLLIDLGKPLNIRGLKKYAVDHAEKKRPRFLRRHPETIAIVGAGPAGITAASDLASKGYGVTVYEKADRPGGKARTCIPSFRLDKDALQEEISEIEKAGVEIIYNAKVGSKPTITDLKNQYDAVLIAAGSELGKKLRLPGDEYNPERVYDAAKFMERLNSHAPVRVGEERSYEKLVDLNVGRKAVVIGSGSVAMDVARSLIRLGVPDVTCACLEAADAMQAPKDEVEEARREGIRFVPSVSPVGIKASMITLQGVLFRKVEQTGKDENGRFFAKTQEGSDFTLECDTLIYAIGERPNVDLLAKRSGLELDGQGRIVCNKETNETSIPGVFAAGDVLTGKGSVVNAMASGRRAALAIDNMLQKRELKDRATDRHPRQGPQDEWIYKPMLEDAVPQKMPHQRCTDNFDLSELGFTDRLAHEEAIRCMKCGYSQIDPAKCIGCGACVSGCPENCITLKKREA